VVRVLPDVGPIAREFDYLVPTALEPDVRVGSRVRINLQGRRVGGWVVADDVSPPDGVALRPLSKVTGYGPSADLIELAEWASWRWAGTRAAFMRSASPDFAVRGLPPPLFCSKSDAPASLFDQNAGADGLLRDAFGTGRAILRLPPAADVLPVVGAAAALGPALIVTPSLAQAEELGRRLGRRLREDGGEGIPVAVVPREWARAAAGVPVVIGARGAAWAPCPGLAAVVVVDGHEEGLQQQQAPTWNAWVVAAERARRQKVPCVVVSSCPTVELLAWPGARLRVPSREQERAGWAPVEVVDRRRDDPRSGLYSPRLVGLLRGGGRILCVLNRKGRVRLLACAACAELVRCERCGAVVSQADDTLRCARCQTVRPTVCLACGSTRMKALRVGVSRARQDLEHLAGQPVGEVTGDTDTVPDVPILVGTEAVLRRVDHADGVAFLDFDQELLAPRYRAAEEALGLLALASRLVGGRGRSGRVLVQTRIPQHEVLVSALTADPGRLAVSESGMRAALQLPPERALAVVSGEGAEEFVGGLRGRGVEILGPDRDRWLVKAADHRQLCDALAAVARPAGLRLRVEVDPRRL
jgi:primosomal protein N' (replication factor Y)